MTPPPDDAMELVDWFFQTTHMGFVALDSLANGIVPADWDDAAAGLEAVHALLRESPPRALGVAFEPGDAAALARLRGLVASGASGEDVRDLARAVRRAFDRAAARRAA